MNNFKSLLVFLPLTIGGTAAFASTVVTVDSGDKVVVTQSADVHAVAAAPVIVKREPVAGDFEGRIADIDYARHVILVHDSNAQMREVPVAPEQINQYRIGDYVHIHPTEAVALITTEAENPREFEGEIIRVDIPKGQIVVLDTTGRERKVQLRQGMIGTYKTEDYVRIGLMSDLKEAKTIETISDARHIEGRIVTVDALRNQIVIRGTDGKDSAVFVRQGQVATYRIGDEVRVYLLANRDQVQTIRVIR